MSGRDVGLLAGLRPDTAAVAISHAHRGYCVFPCRPDDKRPAVDRWEQRACADPDRVARYWPSTRHNIGIAAGPSGLVVLDLDTHGVLPEDWCKLPGIADGKDVLAQLCEWAGQPWPSTYMVTTPSGGWHLYFTAPEASSIRNSASQLGPLVDVRACGGYVVAAGSVVDGKPYEVLVDGDPAPLPTWLSQLLTRQPDFRRQTARGMPGGRLQGLVRTVETAPVGRRNDALYWAACRAADMAADGEADPATVTEGLMTAALSAGLPEREARRTIASGLWGGGK